MNNEKNIEPILNSLNEVQRAEAPAFLSTRIRARLQEEKALTWFDRSLRWISRPAVALSLGGLVLMVHTLTIIGTRNQVTTAISAETSESEQDEFAVQFASFDNMENSTP
ncbi:MAG TPA: hypothetical protein PKK69_05945 [Ferruginibacter sp.]|mgnify:CR=1 FL=1|nr:hypothetical protein [Ferruginibacter sp.]